MQRHLRSVESEIAKALPGLLRVMCDTDIAKFQELLISIPEYFVT